MKKSILVLLSLVLALAACAQAAPIQKSIAPQAYDNSGIVAPAPEFSTSERAANEIMPAAPPAPGAPSDAAVPDQMVIQNADISIVVKDPVTAQDSIVNMTKEMNGYVVTSNMYKAKTEAGIEFPEATITIRVPAESLDNALTKIKSLVNNPDQDVLSENRSGQNVTKEYTDLKSRLTNLEQAEAQLREIMASATRTEDVLSVFNQLTQIREQIEVIKGQMKYFEESAAMSAVNIRILSQESVAPLTIGGWHPDGVARDALQALINALKFLVNVIIWCVLFLLPIVLVIVIPLRLLWVGIRRWRAKRKSKNNIPPSSPA